MKPEAKLLDDGTSLSSVVNCVNTSASKFNNDLMLIQGWACHSTLTKNKRSQDVLLSRKTKSVTHPPLLFNKFEVKLA